MMDDREELLGRIESLEKLVAQLTKRVEELTERNLELVARNQELEAELARRGKRYRPKPNTSKRPKNKPDRRRKEFRRHRGMTRPDPSDTTNAIVHEVELDSCPFCGGDVEATGTYHERFVTDIPEPKPETHCYRCHHFRCRTCQRQSHGRADLDVPGSTVGPRVRLVSVYSRAMLGISLGKTTALLDDFFGIQLSRSAALGHLRWFADLFDPVVRQLLDLLKQAPVVHADETGWRIDGKNVWCWLFANPKIAVFLIDHHRSSEVVERALGTSLPGVLVTDFYAAYHRLEAKKQRCLTHLLRDLAKLREELPARLVAKNIQPLIDLFQDAIALARRREELSPDEFTSEAEQIRKRFDERWWRSSSDPDCQRIYHRLRRHKEELLTFLDDPAVPAENNLAERDIRSVAAARSDGGVNRERWSAEAFAVAKSIVRTCQKNGRNFFRYALDAVTSRLQGKPAPLPISDPA